MLKHNAKMKQFLAKCDIDAMPKYYKNGSIKGCWRLYNRNQSWSKELIKQFTELGFKDFDGKPLHQYSGNGGGFQVFVRAPKELNEFCFIN